MNAGPPVGAPLPQQRWQFIRFVVAAGLSVPVNLVSRVLFSRWMPYELAVVLSHVCGMLTAYALTRVFVFGGSGRRRHEELLRFALVNLVSVALTWTVSVGLVRRIFPAVGFAYEPELVGHIAGLAVSSVSSFILHRDFSFRRKEAEA